MHMLGVRNRLVRHYFTNGGIGHLYCGVLPFEIIKSSINVSFPTSLRSAIGNTRYKSSVQIQLGLFIIFNIPKILKYIFCQI